MKLITDIPLEQVGELRIQWAYAIAGLICAFSVLMIFIMFFIQRSDKPHPSKIAGDKARTKLSMNKKLTILTLIALLLHFHLPIEDIRTSVDIDIFHV